MALCGDVAASLDACLDGWGADWEDLGASSRSDYRSACESAWDASRAELEARQVPVAEDECDAGAAALAALDCDGLRALYLP